MNTNNNVYTVIYTTVIVVIVAAVLAFVAQKLGPAQQANAKAETLRQMMAAAGVKPVGELYSTKNEQILDLYAENIGEAFTIDLKGEKVADLGISRDGIELVEGLKAQNRAVKAGQGATLPVYIFKSGKVVIPIYGAGLWGPVWGYIAIEPDGTTIKGAYFDHESETAGLGARIKDDPAFRAQLVGKKIAWEELPLFEIVKGGAPEGRENAIDAITGATMTSKGLDAAISTWLAAYKPYFINLNKEEE